MALLHLNYFSRALRGNTGVNIILPTPMNIDYANGSATTPLPANRTFPVLYLYHGTYGDETEWVRKTNIEFYAQKHNIAVVMPNVANSFCHNFESGPQYLQYLAEELPEFLCRLLPLRTGRENTFVAGLSMGGYGAWYVALSYPEKFGAAASLSGALDFPGSIQPHLALPNVPWPMQAIFGARNLTQLEQSDSNLIVNLSRLSQNKTPLPKLFFTVGTGDFLYESNLLFQQKLTDAGIDFLFEQHPGVHDWDFWDKHIQRILKWLPVPQPKSCIDDPFGFRI